MVVIRRRVFDARRERAVGVMCGIGSMTGRRGCLRSEEEVEMEERTEESFV